MKIGNLDELFTSINEGMNKNNNNRGSFTNVLRLESDKTYTVRLLPNLKDPSKSVFHCKYFMLKNETTGGIISYQDPTNFGDPSPMFEYSKTEWQKVKKIKETDPNYKDHPAFKKCLTLFPKECWYANVYVIDDKSNPDNNGTVKVLKMGKQLYDIFEEHFTGERKENFGVKLFLPNENGCDFKVKVETNEGGYNSYTKSWFEPPSRLPNVSESEVEEMLENCHDLPAIEKVLSYEEIKQTVQEYYFGSKVESQQTVEDKPSGDTKPNVVVSTPEVAPKEPESKPASDTDFDLDELLKQVENS